MTPDFSAWPGQTASCLGDHLGCGFVYNRLEEPRENKTHQGIMVTWILQGTGSYSTPDGMIPITAGSSCLRKPAQTYALRLDGQMQHARCFLLLPEQVYPLLCALHPGLPDLPAVVPRSYDQTLVDRLWALMERMRDTPDTLAYSLLAPALDLLVALTALGENNAESDILDQACSLLSDMSRAEAQLPEIAEQLGMPYHAFRKHFTLRHGISPGQYRLQKRIECAKHALASGDSIPTVAERLHFSDIYAFTKQFRAMTGETPGQYRMRHLI